jgi:hypothetical protein
MYALVRGREAVRSRRPQPAPAGNGAAEPDTDTRGEEDETLLLGLPLYRRQAAWIRWLLPLAAALLVAVLAVAIWQALPPSGGTPIASGDPNAGVPPAPPPADTGKKEEPAKPDDKEPIKPDDKEPIKPEDVGPVKPDNGGKPEEKPVEPAKPQPPLKERREAGRYVSQVGSPPNVVVSRSSDTAAWQRLASGAKVFTTDGLISLPGYRSELRLDTGVYVTLWGSVPEFGFSPVLESAATLHAAPAGFDADLTLDRGALLLANHKEKEGEAARVRLRFRDEVWDVTLAEPGTEVGVALWGRRLQPYGDGEGPQLECWLFVLKGKAGVKVRYVEHRDLEAAPVPTVLSWDNKGRGLQGPVPARDEVSKALLTVWDKPPANEQTREVRRTLDELSMRLSGAKATEVALAEVLQPDDTLRPYHRVMAVRCLAALDAIPDLIDALGDDQKPPEIRITSVEALRHWIARGDGQEAKLFDPKAQTGYLVDKKYRLLESQMILELLHTFSGEQLASPDTYAWLIDKLRHDKLAVRELAYWHLSRLVPAGGTIPYNPAWVADQRERAYEAWKKLIPDGKLPPPPKQ